LSYRSKNDQVTQREVEPLALLHTQGNWIVLGYCLLREDVRYFRLDRIQQLRRSTRPITERQVDLENFLYYKKKQSTAKTPDIPLTPIVHSFGENQIFKAMQTVKLAPFQLIGIGITTTPQRATEDLGSLWQRVMSEKLMHQIPGLVDPTMYAAYTDYQFEDGQLVSYRVIVGGKVHDRSDVPKGLVGLDIQGGNYQEFLAKGDVVSAVGEAWGKIWQTPLNRNFKVDLEIYDQRAHNPKDAEVSILIGIQEEVMV
ncbi:MAG: WYL domain-containing protein, partial [Bacteroidota bacterium]